MIISASRRTDIPAFYSEWLRNRFDAGYCTVPNPFNAKQIARVSLRPEDIDAVVFWTRHARPAFPLLEHLDSRGVRYTFHYTITGYGRPAEASTPSIEKATNTFRELAARLPAGAVIWRYDPILLGDAFPVAGHLERFRAIAARLERHARRVVIAVVHVYRKTERRLSALYTWGEELCREPHDHPALPELLTGLATIARDHGMTIEACAQPRDWSELGIGPTRCIDDRLLGELFGGEWPTRKDPGQRPECGCIPSKDIGMVDTCTFGCAYCYTTVSAATAERRRREHDPSSPSLVGHYEPTQLPLL
jgi:hypothetical protein